MVLNYQPCDYEPPAWAVNAHIQTVVAAKMAPKPVVTYNRERWETPDHDFIDADWVGEKVDGKPLVVLFHGLEGSSQSHYALALMDALAQKGWMGCVAQFRSCSGENNRLPRAYFAGDTAEHEWIFERLSKRFPTSPVFSVGVSLGGCQVALFASRCAAIAKRFLTASVAVSAPQDLVAANTLMQKGFSRVYILNFLRTLIPKVLQKCEMFPELRNKLDMKGIQNARDFVAFDSLFTAPMHGFVDAFDYWSKSSPKQYLKQTGIPLLLINAMNDPFMPAKALAQKEDVNDFVTLDYPSDGGHVGFPTGAFPGKIDYLPRKILGYFENFLP
ncbi:MAG TPA: alpha/beta hydrolase [Sutterella sp.]|nr:alpha/beta hydrolase [Sutterella sp.]